MRNLNDFPHTSVSCSRQFLISLEYCLPVYFVHIFVLFLWKKKVKYLLLKPFFQEFPFNVNLYSSGMAKSSFFLACQKSDFPMSESA